MKRIKRNAKAQRHKPTHSVTRTAQYGCRADDVIKHRALKSSSEFVKKSRVYLNYILSTELYFAFISSLFFRFLYTYKCFRWVVRDITTES